MTYRDRGIVASIAAALTVLLLLPSGEPIRASAVRQPGIAGRVVTGPESLGGVSVTANLERGGIVYETTTGSDGTCQFDDLPVGVYRLDFDLLNFDIVRRNRLSVSRDVGARVDVTMHVSTMCECIEHWPGPDPQVELRERAGRVVTESNVPLPHARLEIASAPDEVAYADRDGRFRVLVPVRHSWILTASESGFRSVTQSVSGAATTPLTFRLRNAETAFTPEMERLRRGCRCARDLFRHPGR